VPEIRRKHDREFREGAVTIVGETGKPIVEVARVKKDRLARGEEPDRARVDPAYVRQLERELAELRMERDVLKRSVVLWAKEATR
jgi:transposase